MLQHYTPAPLPPSTVHLISQLGHDFNNLLGIILGALSLLRDDLPADAMDEELQAVIEDAISAARDASAVITHLTAAAGRQITDARAVDLNAALADFARERAPALAPGVVLQLQCCDTPAMAWVDPAKLRRCLDELVNNAVTAMQGRGALHLACTASPIPAISVTDRGPGMDADLLKRCAQPYVTTWRQQGHRGLGLSVVLGLLQVSEAQLGIESSPGEGTRVIMEFTAPDAVAGT
jgi:signal transduction histidine kinase